MHKFVKFHEDEMRSHSSNGSLLNASPLLGKCADTNWKGPHKEEKASPPLVKANDNVVNFKEKIINVEKIVQVKAKDDITGPETPGPGMRPVASQAKRSRQDESKFGSLLESGKRFLEDSMALDMTKKEIEVASKFEWLDPSRVKDANGRRPNDPLYDMTTLCISPETLRKMSASQKQYWSVKSKYMDVLLIFKMGKFYELYEMDAEIRHKEQLETSEEAKARGPNSVVQRKLVQVVTPSTTVIVNIGPDAVTATADEYHRLKLLEVPHRLPHNISHGLNTCWATPTIANWFWDGTFNMVSEPEHSFRFL